MSLVEISGFGVNLTDCLNNSSLTVNTISEMLSYAPILESDISKYFNGNPEKIEDYINYFKAISHYDISDNISADIKKLCVAWLLQGVIHENADVIFDLWVSGEDIMLLFTPKFPWEMSIAEQRISEDDMYTMLTRYIHYILGCVMPPVEDCYWAFGSKNDRREDAD